VLPVLAAARQGGSLGSGRRLLDGQEPYSLAMLMMSAPTVTGVSLDILARHLARVLMRWRRPGIYTQFEVHARHCRSAVEQVLQQGRRQLAVGRPAAAGG
jgi:chemotaxis methyl-accepting protein methylase